MKDEVYLACDNDEKRFQRTNDLIRKAMAKNPFHFSGVTLSTRETEHPVRGKEFHLTAQCKPDDWEFLYSLFLGFFIGVEFSEQVIKPGL